VPLPHYGVAIGTYVSFARDPQDQYGRWYHGHLMIDTPTGNFESALDVDTPSGAGVSYRVSRSVSKSELGPAASLPNGWHALGSSPTSGALDYLRSPMFKDAVLRRPIPQFEIPRKRPPIPDPGPLAEQQTRGGLFYEDLPTIARRSFEVVAPWLPIFRPWIPSTGDNALTALEAELPNAVRIYLFGDHYETGQGVHDVHMNQGDPAGSQWWAADGIWQDGAVCLERADGTIFAWQVKFNSQSFKTDAAGHPA
jgi:hypothetical protein